MNERWLFSVLCFSSLTFSHHGHSYRHAHELALGPHVSVDAHTPLPALAVEPRHRRMVGHLLGHEPDSVAASRWIVALLCVVGAPARLPRGPLVGSDQRFDSFPRHFPGTVEGLPQHRVVGLLGHSAFPPLVEGGQVVLDKADYAVLGRGPGCDRQEHVRVGHEVGVHLQEGSLFQNEGWKHHLGKTKLLKCDPKTFVTMKESAVFQCVTRVRSMPSLSWESRWRMMLRWSSRTPRSSSSLSSVSVTSSLGLMSSSPVGCCTNKKRTQHVQLLSLNEKVEALDRFVLWLWEYNIMTTTLHHLTSETASSKRGQFSYFNKENYQRQPEGSFKINLRVCKKIERQRWRYTISDSNSPEKIKPQCSPKPNQVISVGTSNQTATGLCAVVLGTGKYIYFLFSGTLSWKSLSFSKRLFPDTADNIHHILCCLPKVSWI